MIIGLLLYVYYQRPDVMGFTPDDPIGNGVDVYPHYLMHHLPVGLAGLAMAGLFAVAQGSLDSAINAMAFWMLTVTRSQAAACAFAAVSIGAIFARIVSMSLSDLASPQSTR